MCKSHRSSTEIHIGVISHDGCSTNRISFPASTQGFHCPRPRAVALFRTLKFFSRPRCFFSPIPNVFFLSSFHFYQNKRKSQTRMQNAFAALYFPGPKKKNKSPGVSFHPFFCRAFLSWIAKRPNLCHLPPSSAHIYTCKR